MDVVALEKTEEYQGRYRVERTLGAGGMGVVYLAEDIKLGRKVAIKQLRSDMTGNSAEARFRSEAQLLARLNHPNIVRLYDVIEEEHKIALVMELVEGVTLKEWIREQTSTLPEKLDLLMQVSLGLGKAHCLGIIHRDLKPENILVTVDGVAKITDFGIAKALDCDQQLTREDHIAGSVQAMSPEQLQGTPLDARSDLFSLGCIAYELLCGCKPFERKDISALAFAQQIINKPHIPPQKSWPDIPKPLGALLDRLLGKHPEQRPDSALQVYEALEIIRKFGIDADTHQYSDTVTQLLIKPRKKYKRISTLIAGLALLFAGGVWGWRSLTQLTPQYIAVLPIEIGGEISGGDNASTLVRAMVRQALTSTPGGLESSALVNFTPDENSSQEQQLKKLHEKGVTDVLFAHLDCMQQRCNIELQRINPENNQVKEQASFLFLSEHRQESQYTISNSSLALFPSGYQKQVSGKVKMESSDYNLYLTLLAKLNKNDTPLTEEDLDHLEELIGKYPRNVNLYKLYADFAARIFIITNNNKLLTSTMGILSSADISGADEITLLEAQLKIRSIDADKKGFETILKKLEKRGYPSAHLFAESSRFHFSNGSYSEGLIYAQKAVALSPSANHLYLVAITQVASGDYSSPKEVLNKLFESNPQYWPAYALLGVIELENGNLDTAQAAIQMVPEAHRSWRTKSNLGTIFFLQGNYREALKIYLDILESSPSNIQMISQVAEAYAMLSDHKNAEKFLNRLLQTTEGKSDFRSQRYRAVALANLGQVSLSISMIKELLQKAPDDTYVKYSAAQVYAIAQEWRSAGYHIEQLLAQGMSAVWFILPEFQQLCAQPIAIEASLNSICQYPKPERGQYPLPDHRKQNAFPFQDQHTSTKN
ncbi:serine/threonine-protein kinase PknD [Microbulbifer sp. NBRC 101763]|uniref:protein kinase domain-containing protein n=1 Tax=Microbulbifer sp. NBRC 101763 TaxID=1113820 RepID=UPI0030B280AA